MATADVVWAAWDGRGLEHLRLSVEPGVVRADSLIIAVDDAGRPFRARYVVECDEDWKVRRARIEVLGEPVRVLDLRVDGGGHWTDASTGAALALDGCVDIDVYPELTIQPARQEYTLLERGSAGSRWRFRGLDSDFTAELPADRDGLVLDYPGIARRVL